VFFHFFEGFCDVFERITRVFEPNCLNLSSIFENIWTSIDNMNYTESVLEQMEWLWLRWCRLVTKRWTDTFLGDFFGDFLVDFAIFVGFLVLLFLWVFRQKLCRIIFGFFGLYNFFGFCVFYNFWLL